MRPRRSRRSRLRGFAGRLALRSRDRAGRRRPRGRRRVGRGCRVWGSRSLVVSCQLPEGSHWSFVGALRRSRCIGIIGCREAIRDKKHQCSDKNEASVRQDRRRADLSQNCQQNYNTSTPPRTLARLKRISCQLSVASCQLLLTRYLQPSTLYLPSSTFNLQAGRQECPPSENCPNLS
jgi:hypothetical protein